MSVDVNTVTKRGKLVSERGRYQHYKGDYYHVLGTGIHTETGEKFVYYTPGYKPGILEAKYWIRPYNMFFENVIYEGKEVPRFKKVEVPLGGD